VLGWVRRKIKIHCPILVSASDHITSDNYGQTTECYLYYVATTPLAKGYNFA